MTNNGIFAQNNVIKSKHERQTKMSKKDYKTEGKGRKQFSIDRLRFHDTESAEELFGYGGRYNTPPHTAIGGMGLTDIPQRSSEDPVAEFIGPYEPDTQAIGKEHYMHDLSTIDSGDKKGKKAEDAVRAYRTAGDKTDPNGSYTGYLRNTPEKKDGGDRSAPEVPVQDADDL